MTMVSSLQFYIFLDDSQKVRYTVYGGEDHDAAAIAFPDLVRYSADLWLQFSPVLCLRIP